MMIIIINNNNIIGNDVLLMHRNNFQYRIETSTTKHTIPRNDVIPQVRNEENVRIVKLILRML
jgi:hypothetical protein